MLVLIAFPGTASISLDRCLSRIEMRTCSNRRSRSTQVNCCNLNLLTIIYDDSQSFHRLTTQSSLFRVHNNLVEPSSSSCLRRPIILFVILFTIYLIDNLKLLISLIRFWKRLWSLSHMFDFKIFYWPVIQFSINDSICMKRGCCNVL